MSRKIIIIAGLIFSYQIFAMLSLYNSTVFNISTYYTHPPTMGDITISRLPMLFGDKIVLIILRNKRKETIKLIKDRKILLSAVLVSYEYNSVFEQEQARSRTYDIADIFIQNGYDFSSCEDGDKSVADILLKWGKLDNEARSFLKKYIHEEKLFDCTTRKKIARAKGDATL